MDLCESSGDYDYSGDGADVTFSEYCYWIDKNVTKNQTANKQPRTTEQTPSQTGPDSPEMAESGIFNLLRGKKFLAAVVTGSSIGNFKFLNILVYIKLKAYSWQLSQCALCYGARERMLIYDGTAIKRASRTVISREHI